MATRDNRRITGPEKTMPIQAIKLPTYGPFLTDGCRKDKRVAMDIRKMYFGLSNISQAKGSSYVEVGDTKVVCGIYGPREMAPSNTFQLTGQVSCEIKFSPFSCCTRRSPLPDRQVRELSTQLKEALEGAVILEQYPKAQIDVYVTVVEDGGGLLAACITAASLALCDAKIDMYDVVVASSLVWYCGKIYLDPSLEEEHIVSSVDEHESEVLTSSGSMTVAVLPLYAGGQVAQMVMAGCVAPQEMIEGLNAAMEACRKIYAIVKQVLLDGAKKSAEEEEEEEEALENTQCTNGS